jgi:nucleotide-binding universal stress UspA family protein
MTAVEMITTEMEQPVAAHESQPLKSIVVATDGSDSAIAAFQAASLIASRSHASVHVVSVVEPLPMMFTASEGMILLPTDFYQARNDEQRAIVRKQTLSFDANSKWTTSLCVGRPAESIVSFAVDHHADLIIVGANRHGMVGRLFGEETAMEIARLSDVPLLVASASMKRLPKRVVVAMDLESEGLQPAPEAIGMLADAPSISCAHVQPTSEFLGVDWASYDGGYQRALSERFKSLEKELEAAHMRADLIVLHGDRSRELCDYADYCKAELLVVGIKRRPGRTKAVGGRIASNVIRHAGCSVLVVPRLLGGATKKIPEAGVTNVFAESSQWESALRKFTERNAGRISRLEVDDSELGALIEASNYPFIGADYDHKDGRLTLAVGDPRSVKRHLTRTVDHPQAVSVFSVDGRDKALCVSHGGGQTLLSF